ncbi:MAG: hypothetical protein SVN78_08275 [Deferribacterota bacterium]|nr:hypothetical protein [Deferribacterota bacterium]
MRISYIIVGILFLTITLSFAQPPAMQGGGVNDRYAIMYNMQSGEFFKVPIDTIYEIPSYGLPPEFIPIGANNTFFIVYDPNWGELYKIRISNMGEGCSYCFPLY